MLDLDMILSALSKSTSTTDAEFAELLDVEVCTINRHLNKKTTAWRKSSRTYKNWMKTLDSCRKNCGDDTDSFCKRLCYYLSNDNSIDTDVYLRVFKNKGFEKFAAVLLNEAINKEYYQVANEGQAESGSINPSHTENTAEKQIAAVRAYSDMWNSVDKLFLKPDLVLIRPYFYELKSELPSKAQDIDLAIAVALRLRDTLMYSEAFLDFMPPYFHEIHHKRKKRIMSASITKQALQTYKFAWEEKREYEKKYNLAHKTIDADSVSVESIVAYSKYWTDIGDVFLEGGNAKLRKYFFENANSLPEDKIDLEKAKTIAELYNNAMEYSEMFLNAIPKEFCMSYEAFKQHISNSEIIKKAAAEREDAEN